VGTEVNRLFRLTKNHVTEETGWNAYILYTAASLEQIGIELEEAHATLSFDFDAPATVVWEWLNDPRRRNQADPKVTWSAAKRAGGRTGSGATNHCAHGNGELSCESILDWRPFEYVTTLDWQPYRYFTVRMEQSSLSMLATYQLQPLPDGAGTRLFFRAIFKQSTRLMAVAAGAQSWISAQAKTGLSAHGRADGCRRSVFSFTTP
jgi:hypothetical protein